MNVVLLNVLLQAYLHLPPVDPRLLHIADAVMVPVTFSLALSGLLIYRHAGRWWLYVLPPTVLLLASSTLATTIAVYDPWWAYIARGLLTAGVFAWGIPAVIDAHRWTRAVQAQLAQARALIAAHHTDTASPNQMETQEP